jgi:Flp pilus assembly protein TadD
MLSGLVSLAICGYSDHSSALNSLTQESLSVFNSGAELSSSELDISADRYPVLDDAAQALRMNDIPAADAQGAVDRAEPIQQTYQRRISDMLNAGQVNDAVRVAREALERFPQEPSFIKLRALVAFVAGDYATADAELLRYSREMKNDMSIAPVWMNASLLNANWNLARQIQGLFPKSERFKMIDAFYAEMIAAGERQRLPQFDPPLRERLNLLELIELTGFTVRFSARLQELYGDEGYNSLVSSMLGPNSLPNHERIAVMMESVSARSGEIDDQEAIEFVRQIKKMGCSAVALDLMHARALFRMEQYQEHVEFVIPFLALADNFPSLWQDYAIALIQLKRFEEAIAPLQELHRRAPQRKDFLMQLAGTAFNAARPETGWPALLNLAALDPQLVRKWMDQNRTEPEMRLIFEDERYAELQAVLADPALYWQSRRAGEASDIAGPTRPETASAKAGWSALALLRIFGPTIVASVIFVFGTLAWFHNRRKEQQLREEIYRRRSSRR